MTFGYLGVSGLSESLNIGGTVSPWRISNVFIGQSYQSTVVSLANVTIQPTNSTNDANAGIDLILKGGLNSENSGTGLQGGDLLLRGGEIGGIGGTGAGGVIKLQTALTTTHSTKLSVSTGDIIFLGEPTAQEPAADRTLSGEYGGPAASTDGGSITIQGGLGIGEGTPGHVYVDVPDDATGTTQHTARTRLHFSAGVNSTTDFYTWGNKVAGSSSLTKDQVFSIAKAHTTSNLAGADWVSVSGAATGNAVPGQHIWRVSEPVASGTTEQTVYDRMRIGVSAVNLGELEQCITVDNARMTLKVKTQDLVLTSGTNADTNIVIPAKAIFMGAAARVISEVQESGPTQLAWDFGESTTPDRNVFADDVSGALNTEVIADLSATSDMPTQIAAAQTLAVETTDGIKTFTSGTIRITAWWYEHSSGDTV
jgi:hypothetical protein